MSKKMGPLGIGCLLFGGNFFIAPSCLLLIFIVMVCGTLGINLFGSSSQGGDAGIRDSSCTSPLYTDIKDEAAYAKAIDESISSKSPLKGLGSSFVSGAKAAGVNPALIYAIARKESSFGTAGIAERGTNNSFGRTATDSQPHVEINGRNWYKWSSWAQSLSNTSAGYEDEPSYIKRRYIDQGKKTIKDIMYTYAPPSENDTDGYIKQLYQWIEDLNAKANKIKPGTIECK